MSSLLLQVGSIDAPSPLVHVCVFVSQEKNKKNNNKNPTREH